MNPIFTKMVDAVEAANAAPDDYINPAERREREEAERWEYEQMSYRAMLRREAFNDVPTAALWRFESAAVTTPQLAKARGYVQNWDEFKKAGIGLIMFGDVGTGKSYAAGCIANALIDRLESVLFCENVRRGQPYAGQFRHGPRPLHGITYVPRPPRPGRFGGRAQHQLQQGVHIRCG